jgi:S-adenosylmethionine hydrolase
LGLDVVVNAPVTVVTLTTDFGTASPYVAAMKGVLLSVNPSVHILDLGHHIPPQDVRHAAYFLAATLPHFPPTALHVVVVDPGVGTERAILYVEVGGCRMLVPDNGCWTTLSGAGSPSRVIRLEDRRYWRAEVSKTFHGRDIFSPVAGHLSLGVDPQLLGPTVKDWVRLPQRQPKRTDESITGEIIFVDHFGNLISNIPSAMMADLPVSRRVSLASLEVRRWVGSYGEAEPATLVALLSSMGTLEIAECQGNAAGRLGVGVGSEVVVSWD